MERIKTNSFSNWAGNVKFKPEGVYYPNTEKEIVGLVKEAAQSGKKIRLMGATHSWSALIETEDFLVSLDKCNKVLEVNKEKKQVTVQAGIRLNDLNPLLWAEGLSLSNLGTIAEQSVAGAITTGTHGSGIKYGNIATQVVGVSLVCANGEVKQINESENARLLPAVKISLGALGVISKVTLQCEDAFYLKEESYPLRFDEAMDGFEEQLNTVEHFKMWWFAHAPKVQMYRWYRSKDKLKPRNKIVAVLEDRFLTNHFFGFLLKTGSAMPRLIPSINKFINLVHFKKIDRLEESFKVFSIVVPPKHRECEYAIPVEHTKEALLAYKQMIEEKKFKVNFVVEIRFVKGDDIWLSPAYERDVCYLAAYQHNQHRWDEFVDCFEELMSKYGGRPHWGKEFRISPETLRTRYPKWDEFKKVMLELDPNGMFQNVMTRQLFEK